LNAIGYKHDTYEYKETKFRRIFVSPQRTKEYDIIHLTQPHGYEAFISSKAKKILTWHDNQIFTRKGKVQFYNWIRGFVAYECADTITFNSTQSHEELMGFMKKRGNWKQGKSYDITPIPLDDIWTKSRIKEVQRKGFIYIGSIDYEHKNFKGLMETYKKLCDSIDQIQKPPLYIFTSSPNPYELTEPYFTEGRAYPIHIFNRANDAEILHYLKSSIALLHLSLYEGYGLTIMESLAVGTPVIPLKSAKIPDEVAKWTIRSDNPADEALKLYEKPQQSKADAIKYAKGLNKENYAKKMVELYEI
jgi:glycosyltransferase involved in cell wall biosynthesis